MYHFVVLHDLGKKLAELLFRDTDLPFSRNSTHKFAYRCTNIERCVATFLAKFAVRSIVP